MENQVSAVIEKVRKLLKYNNKLKDALNSEHIVVILKHQNDRLSLMEVKFSHNDISIEVTSKHVKLIEDQPYANKQKEDIILNYESFDDLLYL